jgi:hypothetical protein
MTANTGPASTPVSLTEIASLLAWARSLSEAGPAADPAERAAYRAAKTTLLARITPDDRPQRTARD